jgi:hypothetical protein
MVESREQEASNPGVMRAYVESLFDDMAQRLAHQRTVVMRCMDGLSAPAVDAAMLSRQQELLGAVREAVDVLEETKRSFKSKQLGELRVKLERVLSGVE